MGPAAVPLLLTTTATALSCLPNTWSLIGSRYQSWPAGTIKPSQLSAPGGVTVCYVEKASVEPSFDALAAGPRVVMTACKAAGAGVHLVSVIKLVIHEPCDDAGLADCLIA